jgi:hypothetical protein
MNLVSPCTVGDLAEAVGVTSGQRFAMFRAQLAAGESYALRRDGDGLCVACGGFVELEPEIVSVWFAVHPEHGAAQMPAVLRGMRQAFALTLEGGAYSAIRIEVETEAGARMAKLLRATRTGPTASGAEVWHVRHHQPVQGERQRETGSGAGG